MDFRPYVFSNTTTTPTPPWINPTALLGTSYVFPTSERELTPDRNAPPTPRISGNVSAAWQVPSIHITRRSPHSLPLAFIPYPPQRTKPIPTNAMDGLQEITVER